MAEALVVAADRPVPDSPGRWYRGQVVVVQPDGWEWGRKERPPLFFVLKAPGVPVEDMQYLLDEDGDDKMFYGRRKMGIHEATLGAVERTPDGVLDVLDRLDSGFFAYRRARGPGEERGS